MLQFEKNLLGMLDESFHQYAEQIAFTCLGKGLSYQSLDNLSDSFAAWLLQQAFLQEGDRIAIQLPNILQYPVVAIGVLKAGMVVVNVNPLYTSSEIKHQLNDSGAKVLLVFANTAEKAASVIKQTSVEKVIVTELADLHGFIKRPLINFYARFIKKGFRKFSFPAQISFSKALKIGEIAAKSENYLLTKETNRTRLPLDKVALLQYTGGTTGLSKGAVLSHKNLLANMQQLKFQLGDECPGNGCVIVAPLPLYHIYAFVGNMIYGMHKGYHNILIPNPRDLNSFIKALKSIKINAFVGINTLYGALCKNADFAKLDFSELSLSSSAGMALSSQVAKDWERITSCKILEGYGLTETSPIVCCNTYSSYREGTVGKACLETKIKTVDKNGKNSQTLEPGEIYIKGPQVMQGYWQQQQETELAFSEDGWLRTGDIGFLDEDNYLTIVDRIKDMIIISGFNVYPNEIENHICLHPDILEAAAIGVRADDVNEAIKLFVVSTNPNLKTETIIDFCRQGLASYKVPRIIEFRQNLPKSNIGKVLRRELQVEEKSA